jgi:hypothetical protein
VLLGLGELRLQLERFAEVVYGGGPPPRRPGAHELTV